MNKYIRLHNSDNNESIIINVDDICAISTKIAGVNRMLSKINLSGMCNIAPFTVNETPELIVKANNPDFILLHEYETNYVFIVRKSIIAVVDTVKNNGKIKSCVYFDSSCDLKPMAFHESPDKIYANLTGIEMNT